MFNRRPLIPLWGKNVSVVVGEPFSFDMGKLRREARAAIANNTTSFGADAIAISPDVLRQKLIRLQEEAGNSAAESLQKKPVPDPQSTQHHGHHHHMPPNLFEAEEEDVEAVERKLRYVSNIDPLSRRLYAHVMNDVRDRLQETVTVAHAWQQVRDSVK